MGERGHRAERRCVVNLKGWRTFILSALGIAGALAMFIAHVAGALGPVDPNTMSAGALLYAVAVAVLRVVTSTPPGQSVIAPQVPTADTLLADARALQAQDQTFHDALEILAKRASVPPPVAQLRAAVSELGTAEVGAPVPPPTDAPPPAPAPAAPAAT